MSQRSDHDPGECDKASDGVITTRNRTSKYFFPATTMAQGRSSSIPGSRRASLLRAFAAGWSALLIALMAFGALSSARIGTITWGPTHDIWPITIAISSLELGAKG